MQWLQEWLSHSRAPPGEVTGVAAVPSCSAHGKSWVSGPSLPASHGLHPSACQELCQSSEDDSREGLSHSRTLRVRLDGAATFPSCDARGITVPPEPWEPELTPPKG